MPGPGVADCRAPLEAGKRTRVCLEPTLSMQEEQRGGLREVTKDRGKRARLRKIPGLEDRASGQLVRRLVEGAAHGDPFRRPASSGQLPQHLFQDALHLRPVQPALSGTIADDTEVIASDQRGFFPTESAARAEQEEAGEAEPPSLSNLRVLHTR